MLFRSYDYAGVIFGPDLVYRPEAGWVGQPEESKDSVVRRGSREAFTERVKHTYRVLLTRARQGMVIFIPSGNSADPTRAPGFYDVTFEYLKDLGVNVI